ncbi:MAG: hypothetical protein R3A11_02905 [Bdellovibrionota bacterium]
MFRSKPQSAVGDYADLPQEAFSEKTVKNWKQDFLSYCYEAVATQVYCYRELGMYSRPHEGEVDFIARVALSLKEKRDEEVEALKKKYNAQLQNLQRKLLKSEQKIEREQAQYSSQKMQSYISLGTTLFGAFLGRKALSATNINRASTTFGRMSRMGKEKEDVGHAKELHEDLQQQIEKVEQDLEKEIAAIQSQWNPQSIKVDPVELKPQKSDLRIEMLAVVWKAV